MPKPTPCELRDIPQIAALSWRYRDLTGNHQTVPELRAMMRNPAYDILVVRNGDHVAAYGILHGQILLATASHPDHRIPGAATALNQARYALIRSRGGAKALGNVRRGNERSIQFRLRDGFRVIRETEGWIHLEKDLAPAAATPAISGSTRS